MCFIYAFILDKDNSRLTLLSTQESMMSGHRLSVYPQFESLYLFCSTTASPLPKILSILLNPLLPTYAASCTPCSLGSSSSSLFLCSEVPAWVSDVGEMSGTSRVTPLALFSFLTLPSHQLSLESSSAPSPPSSRLRVAGCDLHRLSHWVVPHPSTSQPGSPQIHSARVPQELTLSL